MITGVILVFFLETKTFEIIADQRVFNSIQACESFFEDEQERQQQMVRDGIAAPHKAIFQCVEWGGDV